VRKRWCDGWWTLEHWKSELQEAWDAHPFVIEQMLADEGKRMFGVANRVLWLPTAQPELSSIEFAWAIVKDYCARNRAVSVQYTTYKKCGVKVASRQWVDVDKQDKDVEVAGATLTKVKPQNTKALLAKVLPKAFQHVVPEMASKLFDHVNAREVQFWDDHPELENQFNYALLLERRADPLSMSPRSADVDLQF
jgi:hypothetical protein